MGAFAMELRDLLLLLRTKVLACEKAVSDRGGMSATGGGRWTGISCLLEGDFVALIGVWWASLVVVLLTGERYVSRGD